MYADSFTCQNFPGSCSSYVFYAVDVALKTWQQHIHKQQLSQQEITLTLPAAQPTASKHCNFRLSYTDTYLCSKSAFSALTLLVGRQEGQPASKKKTWVVGCWHGYLSEARCRLAYGPADATATHCLLLQ